MTIEEVTEIIDEIRCHGTETLNVEVKKAAGALPKRPWETLSSFSNSFDGGIIILGVDEELDYSITGITNLEKVQDDFASLCDQMVPPLRPLIKPFTINGKSILVGEIPELHYTDKPCYYKGAGLQKGAFVRVADGDRRLEPYEVQALIEARGQPKHDIELIPDTSINDLDGDLIDSFLARLRSKKDSIYVLWTDEKILQAFNVLMPDENNL